ATHEADQQVSRVRQYARDGHIDRSQTPEDVDPLRPFDRNAGQPHQKTAKPGVRHKQIGSKKRSARAQNNRHSGSNYDPAGRNRHKTKATVRVDVRTPHGLKTSKNYSQL